MTGFVVPLSDEELARVDWTVDSGKLYMLRLKHPRDVTIGDLVFFVHEYYTIFSLAVVSVIRDPALSIPQPLTLNQTGHRLEIDRDDLPIRRRPPAQVVVFKPRRYPIILMEKGKPIVIRLKVIHALDLYPDVEIVSVDDDYIWPALPRELEEELRAKECWLDP
jgi:hypothetical protein